ncbi:uncharacterized protein LOC100502405 [Zea mays]|uniref:Lipase-like protein n=1 Tax=Zea mays TaxID=4577 RepID=K7VHR0_MAIZE|nr:uncharacterized protein LOC100502405 [Zea mays]AQL06160.1 Lipase-like protein [Zea mays]|eukprot:NP_001345012.1 uncharacterized protein LOC100502405 [Zea mays]
MEKESKQGFFSALKGEVVRGLSPGRSRGKSLLLPRSRKTAAAEEVAPPEKLAQYAPDPLVTHSGSLRLAGEVLAPLMEGPDVAEDDTFAEDSGRRDGFGQWVRGHLTRAPLIAGGGDGSFRRSDLRLLLGVMGAPLAPVSVSTAEPLPLAPVKGAPIESSSAQYILQQYLAASGGAKVLRSARNAYAMGKVRMVASEFETATRVVKNRGAAAAAAVEQGGFVLWRMSPDMWYVELAVGGSKVRAGCNGRLVWRHTPWLGAHAAKGPVRPLRRALQGLDPLSTAGLFAEARCVGEKKVGDEECFILKLSADAETLRQRSEGPAEIIRHVVFGYFSQRTGLLVQVEDSHLTRIQPHAGGDAVYWETTISSFLEDYRAVDGVAIAHAGRSAVTLFRFGETAMSHTKTRMEEAWTIQEAAFDVPGLSTDCFIPPADVRRDSDSVGEPCELPPRGAKAGAVHPACDAVHSRRRRDVAPADGELATRSTGRWRCDF